MNDGDIFTAPAARFLRDHFRRSTWTVFSDLGGDPSHRVYSWFRTAENAVRRSNILSWIDIVIADPTSGAVRAIIEIEDTSSKPKTVIGDAMSVLMGDGLAFDSRSDWTVDASTRLIVMVHASTPDAGIKYDDRLAHIEKHLCALRSALDTGNARLGHIVIGTFTTAEDLRTKLLSALPAVPNVDKEMEE